MNREEQEYAVVWFIGGPAVAGIHPSTEVTHLALIKRDGVLTSTVCQAEIEIVGNNYHRLGTADSIGEVLPPKMCSHCWTLAYWKTRSGYGDLSYASDESVAEADSVVARLAKERDESTTSSHCEDLINYILRWQNVLTNIGSYIGEGKLFPPENLMTEIRLMDDALKHLGYVHPSTKSAKGDSDD